jgi:predicted helicase
VGAFADLFSQLDADDRIKGKQFEHICEWFLTNDPVYKYELRRVWPWDEWTGRWGTDAGIDLVAEDRIGHLWAIQAKAYDPAYRVTKRDVNKFLAESGREVFTYCRAQYLIMGGERRLHPIGVGLPTDGSNLRRR